MRGSPVHRARFSLALRQSGLSSRRLKDICGVAAAVVILSACGRSTADSVPTPVATAVAAAATVSVAARPTSSPAPALPTPTAEPASEAFDAMTKAIDLATSDADQQNTALEDRLNAGTTLAPLVPALNAAVAANERAADAVLTITPPSSIARYRATQQYLASVAAGYGTLADAWAALARAAQSNQNEAPYQALAGQATDRFHAAALAKDQATIAAGLAPEGSAPD